MINLGKQSTVIDWIRLVFPYNFDVSPTKQFTSKSGNKIQGVSPLVHNHYHDINGILKVMGLPELLDARDDENLSNSWTSETPLWNYDDSVKHGNIRIMFNYANIKNEMPKSRADMGVAFEISGQGCRELEFYLSKRNKTWYDFFKDIFRFRPDVKVNRLDLAHDVVNGSPKLAPKNLRKHAVKRNIASRLKKFTYIENGSLLSGEILGDTFQIGNSNVRLVVYDKLGERVHSHGDYIDSSIKSWTRWEMRLFYEYSQSFINEFLKEEPVTVLYFRLLRQTMKIVMSDDMDTKNRHRAPEYSWWKDFTLQSDKHYKGLFINHPEKHNSLVRKHLYIDRQVSKSVVKVLFAHQQAGGNAKELLNHWIESGIQKFTYDDVIEIKSLVQQSYELTETDEFHSYVPEQLQLNLDDFDYKELIKGLDNFERYFDQQI